MFATPQALGLLLATVILPVPPPVHMALGFEGSADYIPFDDEVEEGELAERGSPQVQKHRAYQLQRAKPS